MSNVSITDTTYNITVAETDTSVTVTSGDAITVLVDTFTISTAVVNTGSGAQVAKDIAGDTLTLRSITAGDDIVVTQNTDDITIALASSIDANLTGDTQGTHYGAVQGDVTGNVTGNVVGNIDSNESSINTITDVGSITNSTALTIDTQDVIIKPDGGSVYITNDDFTTYLEVQLDDTIIGAQSALITGSPHPRINVTQLTQTGNRGASFAGAVYMTDDLDVSGMITGDLTGDVTGTVSDISNHTTTDLTEGTNLYYTDARVQTKLGSISGHIIPDTDNTYDLGSTSNKWRSLYLSGGSLYIEGQKVIGSTDGTINFTTDDDENIDIFAGANGTSGSVIVGSASDITQLNDTTINLGPTGGGATVNVNGLLEAPDLHIGDLELEPSLINASATNQNLEIRTNGTGYLHANVATAYFGSLTQAVSISGTGIGSVGNTISIVGDLTGDVTGQVSDVSNHDTDDITEGTTNLYYTDGRVQSVIDTNTAGFITDYTVTEADVTQHQAALSITESQISDLDHYTDADARTAISLTSTNTAELSYNNSTGVFSYVSPTTVTASNAVTLQVRNASGVDISKGDAVYISGHSGNKVLIAKADNDATGEYPAIGLAAGAMSNNTDGEVTVYGELAGVDTSSYSVGDVLYLSATPGELTNTRPTGSSNAVQNIGKVARSDSNGIIIISGSGRANDVPNLDSGEVFIGNGSGYEKRALDTDDVSEATNLYYTDARARAAISASGSLSYNSSTGEISYTQPTNVSAFTNDAGYLTSYTETDPIYTASSWYSTTNNSANWNTAYGWGDHSVVGYLTDLSGQTTSNLTEGSNLYFTDARAISAVEGEATLDLTGDITMSQDLDVSGLIKVNDGFTLSSFNPYSGFGGTAMPTTIMGVGQESGWAGMTVRSRGEHDWGLSGYGIPAEAPRALFVMQGGRLDGSSDDYLNNGDRFAQLMMNPYSGYRTGTEWLTPSAVIEASATEDHSSSGMGTKLRLWSTPNGEFAGSTDSSHAQKYIEIQGRTISSDDAITLDEELKITGDLELNGNLKNNGNDIDIIDTVVVTGNASTKTTTIGDAQVSNLYDIHGFTVRAGDTAWASVTLDEHIGGNDKPSPSFSNPVIAGQVWGGTPSSQEAVPSGKRLVTIAGQGSYDDGTGTIVQPASSPIRIVGETTENQTSTARGAKFQIETTPNGSTTRNIVRFQGNEVVINPDGDGVILGGSNLKLGSKLDTNNNNIINTGGDVKIDDNLYVTGNTETDGNAQIDGTLTVDGTATFNGNMTLGNANTDTITTTGKLNTSNGFRFTVMDTATANYISGVLGIASAGDAAYISDGDSGNPCLAVYNGSSWKRITFGSDISST